MKAARIHKYGDIKDVVIDDIPVPEPGLDEVLVQVDTAGINPLDVKLISGMLHAYFPLAMPYTVGTDFSGTVVSVGPLAIRWKKGDRVFGRLEPGPGIGSHYGRGGAFAEFVAVPAQHIASAPEELALEESAALPTAAGTAWQALFQGASLKPGQTVLVHAGTGGVGSFAVQLAKYIGARVIATASGSYADVVKKLGADQVVDYRTVDFFTVLHGIDLVFDTVGGDTQSESFAVLKPSGTLVTITTPPDEEQAKAHQVTALRIGHESDASRLSLIAALCDRGNLRVLMDRSFRLNDVREALSYSASGRAKGKILLTTRS